MKLVRSVIVMGAELNHSDKPIEVVITVTNLDDFIHAPGDAYIAVSGIDKSGEEFAMGPVLKEELSNFQILHK